MIEVPTWVQEIHAEAQAKAAEREQAELEKLLVAFNVPKRYWDVTLDNVPEDLAHREKVSRWCHKYLKALREDSIFPGMFLHGTVGSGKSALAAGTLIWAIRHRIGGYFLEYADLFEVAKNNAPFMDGTYEGLWDHVQNCRLLVIDDVFQGGVKNSYDDLVFVTLEKLLRKRWQRGVSTILTSNFSLEAFGDRAPRLTEVIHEACYVIEVKGINYRRLLAEAKEEL